MTYRERPAGVPGVVVWHQDARGHHATRRILPDGCMDLIWDGRRLFVAGPDSRARLHATAPGVAYVGVRCSRGMGPGLIGMPADGLLDQSPEVSELWPSATGRVLSERVAAAPAEALEAWVVGRMAGLEQPRLGAAVFELAAGGLPVAEIADRLGISVRQLHRRCLPLFGYGPKHLARVLRMERALTEARAGRPWMEVAAATGFADQAHLSREILDLAGASPARLLAESAG